MNKYKISQLNIGVNESDGSLEKKIIKLLQIKKEDLKSFDIVKKSIDARKKPDIFYVYTVVVEASNVKKLVLKNKNITMSKSEKEYSFTPCGQEEIINRPVVVGFGPAGMFCGYLLALYGYKPIIVERGADVETRQKLVNAFWKTGELDEETNVQFGEGGAGTFSDGKLNTGINDKLGRGEFVLKTFVRFGANNNILYDAKPHIGTDILAEVVMNLRKEIIKLGGEIHFNSKLNDINQIKGSYQLLINDKTIETNVLVLSLGHSARDTFEMLYDIGVEMEQKPFAIGVRVEHKQKNIDDVMYGEGHSNKLPASPYKLTSKVECSDGSVRGVYSFCMCPGGYVVNASSEKGGTVVNGMSYNDRSGENSNSAIVTTVTPSDFPGNHPLDGVRFQRELEQRAFNAGNGAIPVQRYIDFKHNEITKNTGLITPNIKGNYTFANIKDILPEYVSEAIEKAMPGFGKNIKGYDCDDAIISAVESRTSSPIRIIRDDEYQSVSHPGIYPCGEGAGYAGGITSAAIDGMKVFEAIASKYSNK